MDRIESGVKESLAALAPCRALHPFYSSVTGNKVDGRELDAQYWWQNIRQPVLFESAIKNLQATGVNIFIEIGPHAVLRSYLNDCVKDGGAEGRVIATLTRGDDGPQRIWDACAQAMIAGAAIDWSRLLQSPGHFLPLPNYPWQRERYWHPVTSEATGMLERRKVHPLLGYPLRQQPQTWENQLDTHAIPSLADHVVGDATVFPGTGFVELALAAALAWLPGECAEIEDLEIRTPLILSSEHAAAIRLQIEEQDGTMRIMGREYAGTDPWTLHGVGRILREPSELALNLRCPALPLRQPDFNSASHAGLTQAAGLAYGPAFQCIDHGWTEKKSVLAVFKIPDCIAVEVGQMLLHPALLDCTFQLIIQLLREQVELQEGTTFVPIRMGRIVFRKSSAPPRCAQATLIRQTAQSLSVDFTVFDAEGTAIAVIREARFRRLRLQKGAAGRLRFLDYHFVPMPLAGSTDPASVIPFKRVQSVFADVARRSALSGIHRRYTQEVDPLLESLCSQWTLEALHSLAADGQHLSRQKLQVCVAANPELEPFFAHLLSQALEDQTLTLAPDGWIIQPAQDEQASAQDIWNSLIADYPDYFRLVHTVGRIGIHLAAILEGTLIPSQVWPGKMSMATLICQVLGGDGKQKIGQALRQLVAQSLRQLPEGSRLGVVEIGQRVPSYAGDISAAMDFRCCDCIFAGTSPDPVGGCRRAARALSPHRISPD